MDLVPERYTWQARRIATIRMILQHGDQTFHTKRLAIRAQKKSFAFLNFVLKFRCSQVESDVFKRRSVSGC